MEVEAVWRGTMLVRVVTTQAPAAHAMRRWIGVWLCVLARLLLLLLLVGRTV